MYRTDKQFMKNPATAPQRIYVGGIQNTVVADDLEQKFKQYGKILGLVLQRGFAFVQYETDEEAQAAIRAEHGTMFHGKKIVVKPANRNNNTNNSNIRPNEQKITQSKPMMNNQIENNNLNQIEVQEPSKLKPLIDPDYSVPPNIDQSIDHQEMERIAEKFQEEEHPPEMPPKALSIVSSENFEEDEPRNQNRKRGNRGGWSKRKNEDRFPPHPPPMDRDRFEDRFRGSNQFYPPQEYVQQPPPPIIERPERNDCEIIVVSKTLTEYAEYIESRLKSIGLIVDLLFPNEDVPIGRVLANISSRGCLYAILIMPQNKENQSLTLNVLHGIPQEHRNMPMEDAFLFMTRNFESYMRGENVSSTENSGPTSVHDKHPSSMQLLINMLAENRVLTSFQFDKLIKYLEEKRELQVKFEVDEGIEVKSEVSVNKQTELQNRIMNILNKSSDIKMDIEQAPPPPSAITGPTPLLKDPTVQKALDSLLLGDMFKNIAST